MQLLFPKPAMNTNMINGHMLINNAQIFAKYGQMSYGLPLLSHRMQVVEGRPRRRRSNHSLVATMDPIAVARRNERERNRVKQVNDGFDALRKKVPFLPDKKKLSKVEILRYAMMYIRDLKGIVEEFDCNNSHKRKNSVESSVDDDCIILEDDLLEDHSDGLSTTSESSNHHMLIQ